MEIRQKLIESLTDKITLLGKSEYINNAIDKCMDLVIRGKGWTWVDTWK
ncbi:hypothetical protein [Mycoplasma sp. ATU-Cv-508]